MMSTFDSTTHFRSPLYNGTYISREMIEDMKADFIERIDSIINASKKEGIDYVACSQIMDEIDDSVKRKFITLSERQELMSHFFDSVDHTLNLPYRRHPYDTFVEKMVSIGYVNEANHTDPDVVNRLYASAIALEKWVDSPTCKQCLIESLERYFEPQQSRIERLTRLYHQALKNKYPALADKDDSFMNKHFDLANVSDYISTNKHCSQILNVGIGGNELGMPVGSHASFVDKTIDKIKRQIKHTVWKYGMNRVEEFRFNVERLKYLAWNNDGLKLINDAGFVFNNVSEAEHVVDLLSLKFRLANDCLYDSDDENEYAIPINPAPNRHVYHVEYKNRSKHQPKYAVEFIDDNCLDESLVNVHHQQADDWQLFANEELKRQNHNMTLYCFYEDIFGTRITGLNLLLLELINRYLAIIDTPNEDVKLPDWLFFSFKKQWCDE